MSEVKEIKINSKEEVAYKLYRELYLVMNNEEREKFNSLSLNNRQAYMRDLFMVAHAATGFSVQEIPKI